MDNFLNFEQLSTFAGMVATCVAIVQVTKTYIPLSPRWLNLIVAAFLTAGVQLIAKGDTSPGGLFLAVLNWLAVTGAAGGAFDYVIQPFVKTGDGE